MKRVLTALVLIPVVLTLVFLGPKCHLLFSIITAGVAMLAAWEFMDLADQSGARPPRIAVLVAILALFLGVSEWPGETASILGILILLLIFYCTFFKPAEEMLGSVATAIFAFVYTGLTMTALPSLIDQSNGPSLVTFLLCAVWSGDIAAMYVGKSMGRHKLAPTLSPNKTWEGAIGSVLGSMLVTGLLICLSGYLQSRWNLFALSYPEDVWYWMVLALIVNVAAQCGDLAESALKRSVGVKDSGTLLPGHGGMLDRIDALLLAAPTLWYAQAIHIRFF